MYVGFTKLLNMSVTAGILVLAVVLLRLCLKKAPKKYICVLWALVALRLVCPFSLSSSLSAYNVFSNKSAADGQPEYIQYNGKSEKPALEFDLPALVNDNTSADSMTIGTRTADVYLPAVMTIWLLGAGTMLTVALVSYCGLKKEVAASMAKGDAVYICDDIPSPFILGVISPRIYLPSGMKDEVCQNVIAHERAHLARKDHWWKPLGYVLLAFHWFNPLMWLAYALLSRDIEAACDEKVVADMDRQALAGYSEALLLCAVRRRHIVACPLAFGEVGVKSRVKNVLHYKKPAFWLVLLALVVCAAAAVVFLTNPGAEPSAEGEIPSEQTDEADQTAVRNLTAVVMAIGDGTMQVRPLEAEEYSDAEEISLPLLHAESSPEPVVGDIVEVRYEAYTGGVYPVTLQNVISIQVKSVLLRGKVTELDGNTLVVTAESASLQGQRFAVYDYPAYLEEGAQILVGEIVTITYNGMVTEEYPGALCGVTKIYPESSFHPILVESENCRIEVNGITQSDALGPVLHLMIENLTEEDITVQLEQLSVNGCMIKSPVPVSVPARESAGLEARLLQADLKDAGITEIFEIGFVAQIPGLLYQHCTIPVKAGNPSSGMETAGRILLDNEVCMVSFLGVDPNADTNDAMPFSFLSLSGELGYGIRLLVRNKTDRDVSFQAADVLVDGEPTGSAWMRTVSAGMQACVDVVIPYAALNDGEVRTGTLLTMELEVHDLDTYNELTAQTLELTAE